MILTYKRVASRSNIQRTCSIIFTFRTIIFTFIWVTFEQKINNTMIFFISMRVRFHIGVYGRVARAVNVVYVGALIMAKSLIIVIDRYFSFRRSVKLAGYSILDIGHSNVQCPISNIRLTSRSSYSGQCFCLWPSFLHKWQTTGDIQRQVSIFRHKQYLLDGTVWWLVASGVWKPAWKLYLNTTDISNFNMTRHCTHHNIDIIKS